MFFEKHPLLCTLAGLATAVLLGDMGAAADNLLVTVGLYTGAVAGSMAFGLGLAGLVEGCAASRVETDIDGQLSDPPARAPQPDGPQEPVVVLFADRVLS